MNDKFFREEDVVRMSGRSREGEVNLGLGESDSGEDAKEAGEEERVDGVERPRKQRTGKGRTPDSHALAAKVRRERISRRMRALCALVPNGQRSDTASMLEEAISYVRRLQDQVQSLSSAGGPYSDTEGDEQIRSPKLQNSLVLNGIDGDMFGPVDLPGTSAWDVEREKALHLMSASVGKVSGDPQERKL